MTRKEYTERCVAIVAVMREASKDDLSLAEFLSMFNVLHQPVLEDSDNG
jgi:hypothetical protein